MWSVFNSVKELLHEVGGQCFTRSFNYNEVSAKYLKSHTATNKLFRGLRKWFSLLN